MADDASDANPRRSPGGGHGDRVKVLHLITHLGFGGGTDNTMATVAGLPRDRYEVDLAAGDEHEDMIEAGQVAADALFLFPRLQRAPRPLSDARVLWELTRFLREQKYDVVHTHNAKAGVVGRWAARLAGVPVVLHTMHLLSWQDAGGRPQGGP